MGTNSASEGYEKRDAQVKPLWISAAVLAVIMIFSIIAMKLMVDFFNAQNEAEKQSAFYVRDDRWQAPEIQLEVHPSVLYENFKAEQDALMNEYAWIDKDAKIVRIPVSRAIELTAERGLPARNSRYEDAGKALIPQESGSIAETRL